jgi:hypothetical protein
MQHVEGLMTIREGERQRRVLPPTSKVAEILGGEVRNGEVLCPGPPYWRPCGSAWTRMTTRRSRNKITLIPDDRIEFGKDERALLFGA